MNINSIHCDLSGVITKSPEVQLNLQSAWELIFKNGKKTVLCTNTVTDDNRDEKDQYKINLVSIVDDFNVAKLFVYIDEYKWPHELLLQNPVEPTQPPVEPTQPPVEPTQPPVEPTQPPVEPIVECLNNPNIVNIVNSDGNKLVFNNSNSYDSSKIYGLNLGSYKFTNIPETHPIAILHDNTGKIGYIGDENKVMFKNYNNLSYPYYYGDIDVIVAKDLESYQ